MTDGMQWPTPEQILEAIKNGVKESIDQMMENDQNLQFYRPAAERIFDAIHDGVKTGIEKRFNS